MEYGCTQTQSLAFAWRFPLGFQIIFLIFILLIVPFYPESPRHLAKTGRIEEARDILTRCRIHPDKDEINQEMSEIMEAIRLEAESSAASYWSMIFSRDALHTPRRILLGGGIQVMQKCTGIGESEESSKRVATADLNRFHRDLCARDVCAWGLYRQ